MNEHDDFDDRYWGSQPLEITPQFDGPDMAEVDMIAENIQQIACAILCNSARYSSKLNQTEVVATAAAIYREIRQVAEVEASK